MLKFNHKKKLKLKRIRRVATKMVPELKDLTCEIKRNVTLHSKKEEKEQPNLITIYTLMKNLEETDRKDLILRRKGDAGYLKGHKKNCKKEFA